METVRWNVAVSADTDQSLRMFLASQGGGRKGDLSRFIEEAVRAHILELSAEQAKAANAQLSETEVVDAIDEALAWARNR
ncbi:ribbon-helix-helix domain-containing protein [Pseudomonas aeruginosa]|uniref:ribbon-helix-helix domain-containing protein n=1 Tax=Pseudomonas aeruginosa TaxID=287 RepID=UPI000FC3F823|nr:ribbon-helix-helix domain-containing protein [Pseudomonas aeruginosa]RUI13571.1 methionine repressor-like protein [Pseudomonas aeruginosa]